MELIAVVMGAESSGERFAACKSMLDYGFANFALVAPEVERQTVPVKLGTATHVAVVPGENPKLLIDKGQKSEVQVDIRLEEQVTAPVSQGQKLGTMTVRCGEQTLAEIPMVAQTGVRRLEWGQIFLRVLRRISMGKGL